MKIAGFKTKRQTGFWIVFFTMCFCLISVNKAAAYSQYTVGNYSYDAEIFMKQGEVCKITGNDSSVSYYEYYGNDENVAWVDESSGEVTACSPGAVSVMVLGYDEYGDMVFYAEVTVNVIYDDGSSNDWWDDGTGDDSTGDGNTDSDNGYEEIVTPVVPVDMTNATLNKTSLTIKAVRDIYGWYTYSGNAQLTLKNTPEPVSQWMDTVDFTYTSSNEEMWVYCSLSENVITVEVSGTGTTTLKIIINGKVFTCKITVVPVYMSSTGIVLAKGDTKQLKVKNGGSTVKWQSQNKNIATVNSQGLVKAKKAGTTVIIATIGEQKFGCAVNVTSTSMKKVVTNATSIAKGTYSQEKRMQKGYYDCSSLVWRSYSPIGVKFGNNNWAPVAADIGKWCMTNGKKISNALTDEQIQKKKLQVGDLFFQTGADNGRYKGIYHVEMFIGYACAGVGSDGKAYLTTRCPARSDGYGYGALVLRPKK